MLLLAIVLLLVASYTSTLHAWWQQRGDIQSTKAEIATRNDTIAGLKEEQARWDDPAYVKQQARARFGWVMPGEVGYRVIGADGTVQGADTPKLDAAPVASQDAWYDTLWGSVKKAGEKPPAAKTADPDPVLTKQ